MRFLAVNAITGQEAAIGKEIVAALKEVGVPAKAITFDDAHTRIPEPTQTGNLIVKLPGTGKKDAKPHPVHDAHGHRAAVRRGEAEDRGQAHRQRTRRHDSARRRQPHRVRGAGHAGGRTDQAEPPAPAA